MQISVKGWMAIIAVVMLPLGLCHAAKAQTTLTFTLQPFSTAALIGNSDGPFYLDFQLSQGNGGTSNGVTLGDFDFGGGSAGPVYQQSSGTPFIPIPDNEPFGGASGSALSQVTLTESSTFNELIQSFTPGTFITFSVNASDDLADALTFNPDEFSFSILDHTGAQLVTTSPDGLELLTVTFSQPAAIAAQYQLVAVPEPSHGMLGLAVLGLLALTRRRRRVSC